jgi:hypothetical protein
MGRTNYGQQCRYGGSVWLQREEAREEVLEMVGASTGAMAAFQARAAAAITGKPAKRVRARVSA